MYYLTIAVACFLRAMPNDGGTLWHLSYTSNIFFFTKQEWGGCTSHFWSLAVEEQFYLLWPLLLLYARDRWLSLIPALTVLLGIAARIAGHALFPDNPFWQVLPWANLTPFGLGAAIAMQHLKALKLVGFSLGPLLTFLSISLAANTGESSTRLPAEILLLLMQVSFAYLIADLSGENTGLLGKSLRFNLLTWLGKLSYSLYLLHNFSWIPQQRLIKATGIAALGTGWIGVVTSFLITVLGSYLCWILVESPVLRLKDYFPYSRSPDWAGLADLARIRTRLGKHSGEPSDK
jgi:peptidoglycan/LPS O-acetylase OafA/YrhL